MKKEIIELLNAGEAEKALAIMVKNNNNNAKLVLADYRNEEKLRKAGLVNEAEFKDYHQNILNRIPNLHMEPDDLVKTVIHKKASIFLSYNNNDHLTARRIKEELEKHHITVKIDQYDVQAGQSIRDFIANETRENKAVMLLLSRNSLKSSWVSYESTLAMFDGLLNKKRIIPVSLDDGYLDNELYKQVIDEIDKEIQDKNKQIQLLIEEKKADTRFIQRDLERLTDARNRLSPMLEMLRSVAVYSLNHADFDVSIQRIAKTIIE